MPEEHKNPIDIWNAVQDMRKTTGWKIFMERYAKEGDDILTRILDTELKDEDGRSIRNEVLYTKRDLYVHQLEALGRMGKVLNEFETEAKNELDRQKHPPQKGI